MTIEWKKYNQMEIIGFFSDGRLTLQSTGLRECWQWGVNTRSILRGSIILTFEILNVIM